MKLKNKISLIILIIWGTLATLFYFGSQRIILNSYSKLESQILEENMDRAVGAIDQVVDSVELIVKDWSIWDDSYNFAIDKNQQFITSTLALSSFQSIDVDAIIFFDKEGKPIFSEAANLDRSELIPIPASLLKILTPKSKLVHIEDINASVKGILSTPSGIMIAASHAILNSKGEGPSHGTLVMAKSFSNDVLQKIIDLTKLDLSMYLVSKINKNTDLGLIENELIDKQKTKIDFTHDNIYGYRLIYDINNTPVFVLKVKQPRNIYNIGREATHYSNIIVFLYSIIITGTLWLLLQLLIVRRIEKLDKHMQETGKHHRFLTKTISSLPDEVSSVERLYHQALHDPLTGLANGNYLYQSFNQYTSMNLPENRKIVILFIDIDHFKRTNDTLGREIGDELLIVTAKRLSAALRNDDLAARIGGDEFVVMLTDIDSDQIELITNKIFKSINRSFTHKGHQVHVSASMGVSVFPDDGVLIDQLIKQADIALYHAKEHGRKHYQFYSESLYQTINEMHQYEIDLQTAIDEKQLCLYYQPIYSLKTKQIVCIEALIRWHHPTKGLLTAQDIIPVAERTDLIYPIGEWILNTACKQTKEWQDKGLPVVPIAVNVSSAQVRNVSLSESIINALQTSSLDSNLLEIEITETGFIDITPNLQKELAGLKASGIKLTIDDFGTGYAGLGYLKSLPVSKLKIDQTFIRDIQKDPDDKAITLAIIAIAHQLNLNVTAEGVETIEQYNFLCYHQVDEVQGFLLCPPLTAEECEKLLSGEDSHHNINKIK
ncbi:MAG TPA: EAL domain-containing protein [Gammaproteobacteria bacterium]|nr:EAL domain-containing protein [Gammaproteobacteria bacterium]